jgi:hypothetical protein
MEKNIIIILSIILVSLLAISAINIIFFTYGKTVEEDIVVTNVKYISTNLANTINMLPEPYKSNYKNKLHNMKVEDDVDADKMVDDTNNKLLYKSLIILGVLAAVTILIFVSSFMYFDLTSDDLITIFANAGLLVLALAIVEILFLTFIVKNFMLADINKLNHHVIMKIQEKNNMS